MPLSLLVPFLLDSVIVANEQVALLNWVVLFP